MKITLAEQIYAYLRKIPKGKVVTYGQIAEYLGNKGLSRVVGNLLHQNPDPLYSPCYKVVNASGKLALHFKDGIETQKKRLENDGIKVRNYQVDLKTYQWIDH